MNQKIINKILAVIIIISLLFVNLSFIGEYAVYATNDNLENQCTLTNNESVHFDAYFKDENGNKIHTIEADINDEIILYLYGKVIEGYLKDIVVKINNANFEIIEDEIIYGDIEEVNSNVITLNKIRKDEELEVAIPIKAIISEEISLEMFNKQNEVEMTALLVNDDSKTKKISKTINTKVQWNSTVEANLSQNILKFIPYEFEENNGIILQTSINTSLKDNILPVKNTKLEIEIPTINGILPEKIYVTSISTQATNGDNGLKFSESNWNKLSNIIEINVENEENNGTVIWEKDCEDIYILTYIYGEDVLENEQNINTQINLVSKVEITTYGNEEITVSKESTLNEELTEKIGDVLTTSIDVVDLIDKGYMYTGFETEYKENITIDIANESLVDSVIIKENEDVFETSIENLEIAQKVNSTYKSTKINKSNFDKMLGENGYIKIYNQDNELIATIDNNLIEDEDNNLSIEYDIEVTELKFETSNIQTVGTLKIENTKTIPVINDIYTKYQIKEFNQISTAIEETLIYNGKEILNKSSNYTTTLNEPTTLVETNISNTKLSTLVENENVELSVVLKNSNIKCSLYENPIIKIQLPEYIETIEFNNNTKILFTDELSVKSTKYDEETKIITIELEGVQTKYNDIAVTEGTTLTLDTNITLKENTPAMQDKIITTVINNDESATVETLINYIIPNQDKEEQGIIEENKNISEEYNENQTYNENIKNDLNDQENNIDTEQEIKENNVSEQQENEILKQVADVQVLLQNDLQENTNVKEGQVINYTVTIVNMGKTTLNDIILEANVPEGTTYREFVSGGNYSYDEYVTSDKTVCTKTINSLKSGESEILEYQVIVNEMQDGIETVSAQATAKIEGYEDTKSDIIENKIVEGMLNIDLITKKNSTERYTNGSEITYIAYIQNVKSVDATNVKITCELPSELTFINAYFAVKLENDGKEVEYNQETNTVTWTMEKLEANSRAEVQLIASINSDDSEIKNVFSVTCDEDTKISSNEVIRYIDRADLSVSQYANIQDTYIYVGDTIEYYITVENSGTKTAENVYIVDTLPDGLENVTLKYKNGTEEVEETECQNKEITLSGFEIKAGETLNITIKAKVSNLEEGAKGTIEYTNKVTVSADEIDTISSNEITHKIKVNNQTNLDDGNQTYSISGIAWLDTSRDGKRDDEETVLKNIEVRLITKDEEVLATTVTDKKGQYTFENVGNGEYLVVFIYDETKYELTKYQAEGVAEAKNSDAAMQKSDLINGNSISYAVTDVINVNESNIYNIDIGLVDKIIFDLSLTKTISKVTVQNSDGIKTYDYKNKTLAKVEIASKDVSDTTIIIEYTITITNEGNIAGYAKSIVDYLPSDLKFSSELNSDWYIGKSGNLYNESLANILIQPGESKEIKLIVTKTMNENNLGTTNNSAEIAESYNDYGVEDVDSVSGNKSSKEDDYGSADMLISLNTGTVIMYTGLSITMLAIIIVAVYMIKKKILIEI